MAKNKYFNFNDKSNTNEIKLYSGMNQELNQILGIVVYYYPKSIISKDEIFLDTTKKFDKFYEIPMVFQNFETFEGDDLYSKFGLFMERGLEFDVSIKEWNECVSGEIKSPVIGDLIYLKNLNEWFELTHVTSKKHLIPFGTLFTYTMKAKKLEYEDEHIISSDDVDIKENVEDIINKHNEGYEDLEDGVKRYTDDMSLIISTRNPFGEY